MKIFLVVMYDRHSDDAYKVRRKLEDAQKEADDFMRWYGDRYKWKQQEINGWLYFHETDSDDGPRVHIQELDLS